MTNPGSRTHNGRVRKIASARAAPECDDGPGHFAGLELLESIVDAGELDASQDEPVELQIATQIEVDQTWHINMKLIGSHCGALDALLAEQLRTRDLETGAERHHADDGRGASTPQHAERLLDGRLRADALERVFHTTTGHLADGFDGISSVSVQNICGAEFLRQVELGGDPVDREYAAGAGDRGAVDGR